MIKKVLVVIYVILATILVFLVGMLFTRRMITTGQIIVKESGAPTFVTIEPEEENQKKLVPIGLAVKEDETDEIVLKYRIYAQGGLGTKTLITNV